EVVGCKLTLPHDGELMDEIEFPWCSVVTRPGRTFRGPADQILRAKSVRAHVAQFGLLWPISAYRQMRESTGGQGFFREANRRLLQTPVGFTKKPLATRTFSHLSVSTYRP